jgi:hypothetical protein
MGELVSCADCLVRVKISYPAPDRSPYSSIKLEERNRHPADIIVGCYTKFRFDDYRESVRQCR